VKNKDKSSKTESLKNKYESSKARSEKNEAKERSKLKDQPLKLVKIRIQRARGNILNQLDLQVLSVVSKKLSPELSREEGDGRFSAKVFKKSTIKAPVRRR
jgi:hypothetical protein